MKLHRMKAFIMQEYFVTYRAFEVILDVFVFPAMMVLVFGFLALYLGGAIGEDAAYSLLIGMLFWEVIFVTQYSVTLSSLWNIWSRNLTNMFVAPVSVPEYLTAQFIVAVFKSIVIFVPAAIASYWIFHFNLLSMGLGNIFLFFISLVFFAFSLGVIILAFIFRFGTRFQAFAWGLLPVLQPLTAVFYPVSVLPEPIQVVAYLFPSTYIFEGIRASLVTPGIQWHFIGSSIALDVVYFIFSLWIFNYMFNKSKEKGQFARLEA